MPLTADSLIEKAIDQRKRKRYEEALASALAAAEAEPQNANAWWQVSLSRWHIGDAKNAAVALRRTVNLARRFAEGWALLGRALVKTGEQGEAKEAFEKAIEIDAENLKALEALSSIYASEDDEIQDDAELSILERIERLAGLSSFQLNRIGTLHYRNRNLFDSIKYWRQDAQPSIHPASVFNVGLAYSHPEISQDADAVDMWRLALRRLPGYEPATKSLATALPRLLQLARNARLQGETVLPKEQWCSYYYLNPFELLNPPSGLDLDDFDAKTLQRLRKSLLQEIDLEDGAVSWLPGVRIDKSRAISVCEELNDGDKRAFHWNVFQNKPLLAFLCHGAHEHFLVDEEESPLDIIEILDDEENGFREWLSEPFAAQFDRVLSKAIETRNLVVLECLLDGRCWVGASHADKCFENARRLVERLLAPLRQAKERAADQKPSVSALQGLLERDSLLGFFNLLPTYFRDHQNTAVALIRDIAVTRFNKHDDTDLSREVLHLTKMFHFKSADLNRQLEEDFAKVEELIREERKYEAKMASGSEAWEITKEGVRKGASYIAAADVSCIRWGVVVTRESAGTPHDFLLAVGAENGKTIVFTWKTSQDIETSRKHFDDLINAALNYLLPSIMKRVESRLASGQVLPIGPCKVFSHGIEFDSKGWIFMGRHSVPWHRVRVSIENGNMIVSDAASQKARISFPLRETDNALVLRFLADVKGH